MKVALLIAVLIFLSGCSVDTSASNGPDALPASSPLTNSNDINANTAYSPAYETQKIDQAKRDELDRYNAKFRVAPEEFKEIDFENFRFRNLSGLDYRQSRYITLKNGEFEYEEKNILGGTRYSLGEIFYVDLAGNEKKEAVVFVYSLSCGASCDGGSATIYFYSAENNKPILLGMIQTGSTAYGCNTKSFAIRNKTIYLEQFGRCNGSINEDNHLYSSKFCVKDLTKTVYYFQNSKFVKTANNVEVTPETNVMNYFPEISIND
jgi:hypothetical protein